MYVVGNEKNIQESKHNDLRCIRFLHEDMFILVV